MGSKTLIGKRVRLLHGGKSTGPITYSGNQRCSEAKTIHERETRAIRIQHAKKLADIKFYFKLMP